MKHIINYKLLPPNLLLRSLRGYLRFFRGVLWLCTALVFIAVSGFLIVYPLWYFAARHGEGYTLFTLGFLLLGALYFLLRGFRRAVRAAEGFRPYLRILLFKKTKKPLCILLGILALYGIILLFMRDYTAAASAAAVMYLVILGAAFAGRRESH